MTKSQRSQLLCVTRGGDEPLIQRTPFGLDILSDIEIHGRGAPHHELKAGGGEDSNAHRLELIQAVRDGKHLELMVKRARTYRQSKGYKNRNFLRFAADKLESIAPTFAGQPFLVNHDTYEQDSRKGTILSADSEVDGRGMTSFFMSFAVVKPDAVISVLDGTIDRFSIGWFRTGAVRCSVHGCDILSKDSCYCWPGETVEVDGKQQIVEYEYQDASGKELSAVNVPAVTGTRIEEYRAALSAELGLSPRTPRRPEMAFKRLAAALKLSALTDADEDGAVAHVEALGSRALEAEIKVRELTGEVTALSADLAETKRKLGLAEGSALDAVIEDAYKAGKLGHGKDADGKNTPDALESMLRDLGVSKGADALKAKISAMRVSIPVGQRVVTSSVTEPAKTEHNVDENPELAVVAQQMGLSLDDLKARRAQMYGARR
jgi:hypothetical protein